MIIVDTTVLVYAIGMEHPLRAPCRQLVRAVKAGRADVATTVEVVQELVDVRARRRPRDDAARQGRAFATLFAPLLRPTHHDLTDGLELFKAHDVLGAFDAVLVATALSHGAEAVVSADRAFASVGGLVHVVPGSPEFVALLGDETRR